MKIWRAVALIIILLQGCSSFNQESLLLQKIESILELPESEINLVEAKLTIDKIIDPTIDIEHYSKKIDGILYEIKRFLGPRTKSREKMLSIKMCLFRKKSQIIINLICMTLRIPQTQRIDFFHI